MIRIYTDNRIVKIVRAHNSMLKRWRSLMNAINQRDEELAGQTIPVLDELFQSSRKKGAYTPYVIDGARDALERLIPEYERLVPVSLRRTLEYDGNSFRKTCQLILEPSETTCQKLIY